ncbi:MAG: AMIN domain-containing protein [Cyanobacteria bacterium P01_H01_bin.119]
MKRYLGLEKGLDSLLAGTVLVAIAANPATAATTALTEVDINATRSGLELRLKTQNGQTPEFFAVNQGKTYQADLLNTELKLREGDRFTEASPAPGIKSITLTQLDETTVRLEVVGESEVPAGAIEKQRDRWLVSLDTTPGAAAKSATPVPSELVTEPGSEVAQAPDPAPEPEAGPEQTEQRPEVMVPDPGITIDGVTVPEPTLQTAPPFLPRAVAPPVGDISVSTINANSVGIDLGTAERVPRLVLRDAPARDVLALLARAAGLNLAFTGEGGEGEGPRVSLDIENEPVQDVFNYVLNLSGLEANRVGRTIFVGPALPTAARNVVGRTFRMNQVSADAAAAFLASMGAEATQTVTSETTEVISVDTGVEDAPPVTQVTTTTETQIDALTYAAQDAPRPLVGLQAIADSRLNSVTLLGDPRLVDLASQFLVQLDLRRRQVAVNVKVVDINLSATDRFGVSFSFGLDDTGIVNNGGFGLINFGSNGGNTPGAVVSAPAAPGLLSAPLAVNPGGVVNLVNQFLLQLQAQITSGNAKLLTDPTLVIQEGQTAAVRLTQEVVTEIEQDTTIANNVAQTTVTITKEPVGLVLNLEVGRIDDNGFTTINVSPNITSVAGFQNFPGVADAQFALLQERELTSGDVRVRDGQTLVLTGIIQDQERVSASKIPILGDLPLIGALFRSTSRENTRAEVVIMVTPNIVDDSDQAVYGYSYQPSEEIQDILDRSQVESPTE